MRTIRFGYVGVLAVALCGAAAPTSQPTTRRTPDDLLRADNQRMQREITALREQLRNAKAQIFVADKLLAVDDALIKKLQPPQPNGKTPEIGDDRADVEAFWKAKDRWEPYHVIHYTQTDSAIVETLQHGNLDGFVTLTFVNDKLTEVSR